MSDPALFIRFAFWFFFGALIGMIAVVKDRPSFWNVGATVFYIAVCVWAAKLVSIL